MCQFVSVCHLQKMINAFYAYDFRALRKNTSPRHYHRHGTNMMQALARTHALLHACTHALSYLLICTLVHDVRYQSMSVWVCALSDSAHAYKSTCTSARTQTHYANKHTHTNMHTHTQAACIFGSPQDELKSKLCALISCPYAPTTVPSTTISRFLAIFSPRMAPYFFGSSRFTK